jgi:hypothetical protein
MMQFKASQVGFWLMTGLLVTFPAGCGKPSATELPAESGHIKSFFNLVAEYSGSHRRTLPANIEELKAWAKKEGKQLSDEDFKSPRDGQEYVIYPGAMGRFIVHEQTGVDGKRYLINPGGAFMEATEEQIENMKTSGLPSKRAGGGQRGGK